MPGQIMKNMNWWGNKTNREEYGNKLQFLNKNEEQFDWDDHEFDDTDELVEEYQWHIQIY